MSDSESKKNNKLTKSDGDNARPPKDNGLEKSILSQVGEKENIQDESLEEILLQELLQKTTQLQLVDKTISRMQQELDITRQIIDCQTKGILFADIQRHLVYANTVFCSMTGYNQQDLKEKRLDQFVALSDPNQNLRTILQEAMHWGSWHGKVFIRDDNNSRLPFSMSINYRNERLHEEIKDGFICQLTPVDRIKTTQPNQNSLSLFSYDALTGLPDRLSFQQHFSHCIEQAGIDHSHVGLLYIDLDHFKRINRMLGSGFGDELLCRVTAILQQCGNASGANFVARLSGDEFALILPSPTSERLVKELADRILRTFQHSLAIKSRDIFVTPSIGISLYPEDGTSPPELLRNADTAMETAKARGGNSSCRWNNDMDTQALQNLHLENDLRKAVAAGELFNHYQPQIDLTSGVIVGMEALARWEHPVHGNISPVIFIPIAENTGLIEELGLDLVRVACEQGRKWLSMGFKGFTMAVNLSGSLLRRHDLFEEIMACLESTGFPPASLEVEFTESVLIENMDNTIELINKCRKEGIKMAIDDFGTGYSSLSYLQRFAVDKIKIDRSFIMNVTTNASDAAITMAIIAIAKKLNFQVLAEGVETEEQLFFLQENQCDECQGFLFNKPVTAEHMTNLLMRDSSVALKHKRIIDKFYSIKEQNTEV
ncbi:MAG: EAL domain-containing protein [Thermodesulfobacteriota bacterium]|nr:EAL domain-containing protein [Thermodesulfobacteriota bacterium]